MRYALGFLLCTWCRSPDYRERGGEEMHGAYTLSCNVISQSQETSANYLLINLISYSLANTFSVLSTIMVMILSCVIVIDESLVWKLQ